MVLVRVALAIIILLSITVRFTWQFGLLLAHCLAELAKDRRPIPTEE